MKSFWAAAALSVALFAASCSDSGGSTTRPPMPDPVPTATLALVRYDPGYAWAASTTCTAQTFGFSCQGTACSGGFTLEIMSVLQNGTTRQEIQTGLVYASGGGRYDYRAKPDAMKVKFRVVVRDLSSSTLEAEFPVKIVTCG